MRFCIVDIETTGFDPASDRITEVAAIQVRDGIKTAEFHALVNPGKEIPSYITSLTGLEGHKLKDARTFAEIATELAEFLDDHIIVAHQAHFDISFLRESFKREGVAFTAKSICTLRLSKKVLPGLRGFTLSHVCHFMGITNPMPHRAWGDAQATVQVFSGLLGMGAMPLIKAELHQRREFISIPVHVSRENWDSIPSQTGIYYLIDRSGKVIYVGKALDLKKRVPQHFKGGSERAARLRSTVGSIKTTTTGSYLIASLMEDMEIRRLWPYWNRAQKERARWYGVVMYTDQAGDVQLRTMRLVRPDQGLLRFGSAWEARNWLFKAAESYALDPRLCGLPVNPEQDINHKKGVAMLMSDLEQSQTSVICFVKGRSEAEEGVVVFSDGRYVGFGFVERGKREIREPEDLLEFYPQHENNTLRPMLRAFLSGAGEPFEQMMITEGTAFAGINEI